MPESANLFIEHETEQGNTSLGIYVDSDYDDQSRAEVLAALVAFYSRPLLAMSKKELAELRAVVVGKSN